MKKTSWLKNIKEMRFVWFFFLLTGLGACEKNMPSEDRPLIEAMIVDWGSPSVDGCGWVIRVSPDSVYSPVNLERDFEVHELKVLISFEETGEDWLWAYPYPAPNYIPEIRIHEIKKL